MIRFLFSTFPAGRVGFGLLVLRLVVGTAFMFHGWPKVQNAFEWMERPGEPSGVPDYLQAAAAWSEFGGGTALILGLLTPLASLGLAATMATAIFMVHIPKGDPFVPSPGWKGGSWELAAAYFASVFLLLLSGPGRFSVDALLFCRCRQSSDATREQAEAPHGATAAAAS